MNDEKGRCAILLPHGILNRIVESSIREEWVKTDSIDAIISIGKNLFYNSPMEACIVVCRKNKPIERRGKILFINARDLVDRDSTNSYLSDNHIQTIVGLYRDYRVVDGRSSIIANEIIPMSKDCSLSVSLYVKNSNKDIYEDVGYLFSLWETVSESLHKEINLFRSLLQ